MSASGTLDLANYTTVWDHNFSSQPNLNGFGTVWGDVQVQNGAAVLTSTAANGWPQAGFMITPSGASAGNGYGLYSITMSLSDNGAVEGPGGYACLWPSTNNWPGPELDLVEKQDASSGTNGYSTIHWAGANGSNQYNPTMLGNIDVTQVHTYAMDWEPGRITLYVDGQEIYTTTQNVPADYADGGQNEAFGAGEEPAWAASQQGSNTANQVQVYDIGYSAYTPGAGSTSTPSTGGGTSTPSTGGSTSTPSAGSTTGSTGTVTPGTWINVSNPGTVQEASPGAGVTVTETISDPGLTTAYVMVMNSANQGEANWQAVSLDATGSGTFSAHFQNSGDYVVAVDNPNSTTDKGWSNAITITDPATTTGGTTTPVTASTGSGGSSAGAATGPTNIALSGDNLYSNSQAWTVVGQLSATDSNAVGFALGNDPGKLFSIDGTKLEINQNMPASPAASYQVGIIATDTAGGVATQTVTVDVKTPAAAGPSVTATDQGGVTASLPVASGTQTFAAATTGLAGAVTETTANGVSDFATTSGSGVTGLTINDSAGGSYQTDGFATVNAALGGAAGGDLSINDASNATVSLGSGNYDVRVSSLISSATVSMTGGSGTDQMTFLGTGHANFVAGSGSTVIFGGEGGNSVTFGTGTSQVWGGVGADSFTFHTGDGLQAIETFDAAKGDMLNIDSSLQSSLHETSAGGNTLLTFGSASRGILLQGVSSFDTAQIHWI